MNPKVAEAQRLLAAGKLDAALKAARLAAAVAPTDSSAHALAAQLLLRSGRPDIAVEHSAAIARIAANDPAALGFHTAVLTMLGRGADAVPFGERAVALNPNHLSALTNLTAALVSSSRPVKALEYLEHALTIAPSDPNLLNTKGQALHAIGRASDAIACLAQALRTAPMEPNARLSSASFFNYMPNAPRENAFTAHLEFGKFVSQHTKPGLPEMPDTSHKRRIGFISADFRTHSVAFFIEPLLEHLPRDRFEVVAFHTNPRSDELTRRIKSRVDVWRELRPGEPPAEHARRIAGERLHAIVELAGLTRGHALHTLAFRPAPLQIAYLGYPNTTGCPFMDVRIVDTLTDPPDADAFHSERLLRLEPPFLCYRPPDDLPAITPRPDRPPTFGCFGAATKHNDVAFQLWARALERVPGSRLVIKSQGLVEILAHDLLRTRLQQRGIDPSRIDILPPAESFRDHLAAYNLIDVALDTFPYHGTTTTCEALAMGVPVVSRVGDRHASRVGLSLLTSVGLPELATSSDEDFAALAARAIDPAGGVARGDALRAQLRASPLCDAPAFSRRFGAAVESEILRFATKS